MNIIDIATWLTFGMVPLFILLDVVYRARRFETPRYWRLRAVIVTAFIFAFSFVVPMFWGRLLGERTVFNLGSLGTWLGAAAGVVVYEFFHYWYHRAVHKSDFLFRWVHQMHHSVEGLDPYGAYYLAPSDAIGFITLQTLVFGPLLGLPIEAVVLANVFLTFNAIFQHANIRTPQWLGYIIQRPESHGIHHQRGVHAYNYSDLPLWDMVFGTFRNPRTFEGEIGFWHGASSRIGDMLLARDVSNG